MYPTCRAVSNYPNILDSEVIPRNTLTTEYTFEGASQSIPHKPFLIGTD